MMAARKRDYHEEKAEERKKEAGKQYGRGRQKVVENFPQPNEGTARDQAGAEFRVSGKSVDAAQRTTGKVLANHRPSKDESQQIVDLSQSQRAKRNGVGIVTQRKLDRLAAFAICDSTRA